MHSKTPLFINHMAMINALGYDHQSLLQKLKQGDTSHMKPYHSALIDKEFLVGKIDQALPEITDPLQHHNSRNNQIILHCLLQLDAPLDTLKQHYSANRIGVVMGTSTSGIAEGERAIDAYSKNGLLNDRSSTRDFDYSQIQMSSPAEFIADYLELSGPAYSISTACSSSGKVFASAQSLIENNVCDAVIVGGADSLCDMTLGGFDSLEAISDTLSEPFGSNRQGINIGEGAALFIITRTPSKVALLGVGESSDAHHISAPHPEGEGAAEAMIEALRQANLTPQAIDYLNLHGTGTPLNDAMESKAVIASLSDKTLCSSTKPLTGHTLGAAGATEIGFCWLLVNSNDPVLPLHHCGEQLDPDIPTINLVQQQPTNASIATAMSNSFAFGGNNVSVIIGRAE